MALVRLSDAIVPDVFTAYMLKETMIKAQVFASGLVSSDPMMGSLLSGGGTTFQAPFWGDLDTTEATVADDNPASVITPGKISASKMSFIRQFRTRAWSTADLVSELAGDNPMARIVSRVSDYWAREFNTYTIRTMSGITADCIANDSGDFVYNAGVGVGTATPTEPISAQAVLEAKQTLGDASDILSIIVMHSRLYTNLQTQNLITFIPNSEGRISIPTYLGYRVVISDTMPATAVSSDTMYTSYLCAPGFLGYAEVPPAVPVETFRNPEMGMGSGVETLYTRRQFALHPKGYHWAAGSMAGQFPTNTELATATNWDRKFAERKQIPIAVLRTLNG